VKVHPAADFFPMMTDEELETLAADIAENGLRFPIIVDKGVLIDGRNRLKACERASVEPQFEELGIRDPLALIFSANIARRNLTRGQLAMATAMIYPEPEKGGRGKETVLKRDGFSKQRLSDARRVLRHRPTLAQQVLNGTEPLDAALLKMRQEQNEALSAEKKMAFISEKSPKLADLIEEGRLTVDQAFAAAQKEEQDREQTRQRGEKAALNFGSYLAASVSEIFAGIHSGAKIVLDHDEVEEMRAAMARIDKLYREQKSSLEREGPQD
jgi:ParB-like chromosome segregation protein Spo0J